MREAGGKNRTRINWQQGAIWTFPQTYSASLPYNRMELCTWGVCTRACVWAKQSTEQRRDRSQWVWPRFGRALGLEVIPYSLWVLIFLHAKWDHPGPAYLMRRFVKIWDNGCALKAERALHSLMRMLSAAQCYLKSLVIHRVGAAPLTTKRPVFLTCEFILTNGRVSLPAF